MAIEDSNLVSEDFGNTSDPVDEIANLLGGNDGLESKTRHEKDEENEVEDEEAADSEESDSESEEDDDEEKESDGDGSADGDDESEETWSGVLGIDESKISVNEKGDLEGLNVKIDGKTSTVSVDELISGYQTNKSFTTKSQKLAEERKSFDEISSQAGRTLTDKLQNVEKLASYMNDVLSREFKGIDWNDLRVSNPAEYAASMQDFNERKNQIAQINRAINEEQEQRQKADQHKFQENNEAYVFQQMEILLEKNPEWSDERKLKSDFDDLSDFTSETYGFTTDEFNSVTDARMIELIKDAKKYRQGSKTVKAKLVKKLPKYQKSRTTSAKKKASKLDNLVKASRKAQGQQKRDLQGDAIAQLLMGE